MTMNNNGSQIIQQMMPNKQTQGTTYIQQNGQLIQTSQMMPQQMQIQQIQVQSNNGQQQYVSQQEQIQNQLIQQSQQIAMQQQNGMTVTTQANGMQQISIQQQPKQMVVGQQAVTSQQTTSIDNSRPVVTMVSIGSSAPTLSGMHNMSSPIQTSSPMTLQPPPNPLAAMTNLSFAPNGMISTNTISITKDDKQVITITSKTDDKNDGNAASIRAATPTAASANKAKDVKTNGAAPMSAAVAAARASPRKVESPKPVSSPKPTANDKIIITSSSVPSTVQTSSTTTTTTAASSLSTTSTVATKTTSAPAKDTPTTTTVSSIREWIYREWRLICLFVWL